MVEAVQATAHEGIIIKNNSGEEMPPYGIGRVSAVDDTGTVLFWQVEKPSATFARLHAVNSSVAIAAGELGLGTYGPYTEVLYDDADGTPGTGDSYGAKSGQWSIVKDRPGFTILGKNTLQASNTVKVIQEPITVLTGRADGNITFDSTGTVDIHFATSNVASEYEVTASLKWMHNDESITSGKEVLLNWVDGVWLIVGAECEA